MIFDLTHPIAEGMPVWPGTPSPKLEKECTIEKDGFLETHLGLSSHTGTHIDAPAHILPGSYTLDKFRPEYFIGRAIKIDLTHCHHTILEEEFLFLEDFPEAFDFVLLQTGWSRYWGHPAYFRNFPVLSLQSARFLSSSQIKGIGLDAISFDLAESNTFPNHHIFMGKGILLIENLTGLEPLPLGKSFELFALPLYFRSADGAPARVIART
ncbi:MAG TPA: cyclase family protein [Bacteroidales bacterium]|jgi:kynurenine formamidase|nr:cyclase family protein [Bacteroidales bacterium]MDI9574651.1 cyclase family protein [Bacteroidota bacterium]MBP9511180.1 cyclase family protein [Bacteroidales bacterium]MBP9588206.1 cyclase family protein [Bacteroidales bacterium]HOE59677.1 cyclase family protein [Bacteroidales bacterium]